MVFTALPPDARVTRILIVDDDAKVRGVLSRVLTAQGYDTMEADGTAAALACLERVGDVTLVVSDIHMPGRDGHSLLREIRERYPDIAVLMLTGDADVATAVACLSDGAMDYLSKPVLIDEVRARVGKALDKRKQDIELRTLRENYQSDLERQVLDLSQKNQAMFLAQVQMAVRMLEAKDPYTSGHSGRVSAYAVATGRHLGLGPEVLEQIRLGGELHDIGKIGTRDAVLNKPSRLTESEFIEMKRHTVDGEEMLSVLREDHPEVLHIVRWHHERMDGSGFPDGLRGSAIPITARIVAVADAFDAITSTRAYRDGQGHDVALAELTRCAGPHFDPDVVKAFCMSYTRDVCLPPRA